jgi:hypothetical protein
LQKKKRRQGGHVDFSTHGSCTLETKEMQYHSKLLHYSIRAPQLRVCLVPHFTQKILGFGPSFCKMKLNITQIFWQKDIYSPFWILASRGQKKAKKTKKTLVHLIKNLAFWMKLNTPMKILAFYISSFQSN